MGITKGGDRFRSGSGRALMMFTFILISLLIIPSYSGYWSEWRGGPDHRAVEDGETPDVGELVWSYQTGNQVLSSPVFYEGGMLIGSDDGSLYCFDPASGELNWKYKTNGEIQASALIHDGRAYFGSFDRNFYCIDLPSVGSNSEPSLVWNTSVEGQVISSSHMFKNSVIFADTEGYIYRLFMDDGEIIWKERHTEDQFWASPLIISETEQIIIGDVWKDLFIIDANDGSLEKEKFISIDTELYSSGTVEGSIYFTTGGMDQSIYAYNFVDDEFLWKFDTGHDAYSTPVIDDDKVYCGSFEYLWCLPLQDPNGDGNISEDEVIWSAPTHDFQGGSSPFVADGKVFVGSDDYKLYCFDQTSGQELWSFETKGYIYSSPALFEERIYFGSSDRNVYCIGKRPPGLVMEAEVEMAEITSDNITALNIVITDDEGIPVEGVSVSFITSAGFIAFDDKGNTRVEHITDSSGKLTLYFFPVHVSSRSTIDISISSEKEGLQGTKGNVQIIVEPGEEGTSSSSNVGDDLEKRVPYYLAIVILIVINIILLLLVLLWFVRNKIEKEEGK